FSSSVQSRFVRRVINRSIVSAIQSGHYLTHATRGRAVGPDAYVPRRIGRTKGGLTSKLHAVCDGDDRGPRR
ncbi:MAG: hypothetical protein ACI87T_002008, partial [Planctomycetota bacterium]